MTIIMAASLLAGFQAAPNVVPPDEVAAAPAASDIEAPVEAMLQAISARDPAALEQTLATSVEPEIVYYWGETVSGREAIVQWHREWFAEPGWRIVPGPASHSLVGERLATVAAPVRYIKTAERQFVILISYTLLKEAEGWRIARIQQTLLEGPDAAD
ncbi:nuclear transport factor 2 family protein [Altererythrobacter sp. C41]|uniref:nuclear transport factor 2 family protein n=1 Tax=Altererythrobacter sp. C41 TaxID=2806021 RepID=UPI0019334123|nr:nuclear transport factor 2 family protein [Altererythrobacter sp. C41]MBM0168509.1 nuclear transport factor 2 family protein [Altererythrobacter sp. C41]